MPAPPGRGAVVALLMAALVVALLAVCAPVRVAYADDPLAAKEMEVERQLGCPICTNLPLNVCDNQICTQMKGIIHQKLADGETPDAVVAYFVSRYGEGILLTPPQQGFNLAVWYLPVAAILVGALIVWTFVRRSMRRQKLASERLAGVESDLAGYRERVRREVGAADLNAVERPR
jgi:cytochrome c-type biogenesis protein CcmH